MNRNAQEEGVAPLGEIGGESGTGEGLLSPENGSDGRVVELPILLTAGQLAVLGEAAVREGSTAATVIRRLLGECLKTGPMDRSGHPTNGRQDPGRGPTQPLTAADLLGTSVVSVHHRMSIARAASVMDRWRLHVLPVTDDRGQFIGVLTAADVLRWALDGGTSHDTTVWTDWQLTEPAPAWPDEVRWHLVENPVVVEPDADLTYLAQLMSAARASCAVVVDSQRRPIGILSIGDVLASWDFPTPRSQKRALSSAHA